MSRAATILLPAVIGLVLTLPALAASQTKVGFLIPSQCKSEEGVKPEPEGSTDAWPAPHSTACALLPACIAPSEPMPR